MGQSQLYNLIFWDYVFFNYIDFALKEYILLFTHSIYKTSPLNTLTYTKMNLNEMDFGEYDDEFICPICCEDLEEDDLATRYCECKFMVNIFPKFI